MANPANIVNVIYLKQLFNWEAGVVYYLPLVGKYDNLIIYSDEGSSKFAASYHEVEITEVFFDEDKGDWFLRVSDESLWHTQKGHNVMPISSFGFDGRLNRFMQKLKVIDYQRAISQTILKVL